MSSIHHKPIYNRIGAVMSHITRYAFKGGTRLADDAGVSKSAVCRLLNGQSSPSYTLLHLILRALERHLGRTLDPREIVSLDGHYPTASVCRLCHCTGCLPAQAFDAEGNIKPEFKHLKPGHWSISNSTASHSTASPITSSSRTSRRAVSRIKARNTTALPATRQTQNARQQSIRNRMRQEAR